MSPEWRKVNLVCSLAADDNGERVVVTKQPMPPMREDLVALFDRGELSKYFTAEELPPLTPAGHEPSAAGSATAKAPAPGEPAIAAQQPAARQAHAQPTAGEETR